MTLPFFILAFLKKSGFCFMIFLLTKKENITKHIIKKKNKGSKKTNENMIENIAIVMASIELKICFTFVFIAFIYDS
jgi:hypothetical protein